jgi:hypothetical protein
MLCASHPPSFDHINNIWWAAHLFFAELFYGVLWIHFVRWLVCLCCIFRILCYWTVSWAGTVHFTYWLWSSGLWLPCDVVASYHFGGLHCLHLQMEKKVSCSSRTLVTTDTVLQPRRLWSTSSLPCHSVHIFTVCVIAFNSNSNSLFM